MDLERARDFIRANHRAVLATRRAGGSIQQSPVLVTLDEAGRAVISSREPAYKTRNIRADPWAQLCVFTDKFFGRWVYVEGHADVLSLPGAMESLVDYYRSISGEHPDWDDYRRTMEQERRVLLRVELRTAGPDWKG